MAITGSTPQVVTGPPRQADHYQQGQTSYPQDVNGAVVGITGVPPQIVYTPLSQEPIMHVSPYGPAADPWGTV
ncbi:unnamed protein product, partial [Sphacelaria rigidula]